KGNWNVEITSITLKSQTGKATEVSSSYTATTASFEADLYMPGDSIEYEVTVTNNGNIDAVLQSITPNITNPNLNVRFTHSEIDKTPLTAGKTITFTMKVIFDENANSIPNINKSTYSLNLNYIQYDGSSKYDEAVETSAASCFLVSDDGTLLLYDRNCGENVMIPATVNGIAIKRVQPSFLASTGSIAIYAKDDSDNGYTPYVMVTRDLLNSLVELYKKEGATDEEINELFVSAKIYEDTDINSLNPMTFREIVENYSLSSKYKIYKDTDETINVTNSNTGTDYNLIEIEDRGRNQGEVPPGWYCSTEEVCHLFKEYICNNQNDYGSSCRKYMDNYDFKILDDLEYVYYSQQLSYLNYDLILSTNINTVDFSQAIYMDDFSFLGIFYSKDNGELLQKLVMPPNIKTVTTIVRNEGVPTTDYELSVKQIVFPKNSTTKSIGYNVFKWLNVDSIILPESLEIIGEYAFTDARFSSVTIPSSVVYIGPRAFSDMYEDLTDITFESGSKLSEIGKSAFSGNNIKNLTIPSSVEIINAYAFSRAGIETINFESSSKLKTIQFDAFANNNLTNTGLSKLPSTLIRLDTWAFSGNSNLTQITLTSPTDIYGWPNGGTVNGIMVTYER
ncbi:MAG: leucine-rich repeat protein, partial [Bacilli bacterium]